MNVFYLFDDLQGASKKNTLIQIVIFLLAGGIAVNSVDSFLDRVIVKDIVLISYAIWFCGIRAHSAGYFASIRPPISR
ncbi:MAG: hypothetical protein RLZ25_1699 [Pseudomonadota bacterium]|jgi:hypothetical protein